MIVPAWWELKVHSIPLDILAPRPVAAGEALPQEPATEGKPGEGSTIMARLVAAFLSTDGRKILAAVAHEPSSAKVITARSGVERSRCYSLITDLRDRGLIRDNGDGYELVDRELWQMVGGIL